MSTPLLLFVSFIYICVGINEMVQKGSVWWLLFWACYAGANIFWVLATRAS